MTDNGDGGAPLLLFDAGGRRYGCALASVREILPRGTATRLPGAPGYVLGLMNLRGRLVTLTDLAGQLGATLGGGGVVVLVESRGRLLGLVVDVVQDVRVPPEVLESLDAEDGRVVGVRGLAPFDDGVAVVLDTDELVGQVLL